MSNPNEDRFLKFLAESAKRRVEALVEEKGLGPPEPKKSIFANHDQTPPQDPE